MLQKAIKNHQWLKDGDWVRIKGSREKAVIVGRTFTVEDTEWRGLTPKFLIVEIVGTKDQRRVSTRDIKRIK